MRFFVSVSREPPANPPPYPFAVLAPDNWDDYTFKTLFHPVIYLSASEQVDLRHVKILQLGQESGPTPIQDSFVQLDASYCSLGLELAYYESLLTLREEVRREYLSGLRDAAADSSIRERFQNEPGFGTSLLREGAAERALNDAPALLRGEHDSDDRLSFTFSTQLGVNEFGMDFRFRQVDGLPGRISTIIGYNGAGKTQLLGKLAMVARADLNARRDASLRSESGHLEPNALRFGWVVAVSYSAFDTFELPPHSPSDTDRQFGYTYCGLRRYGDAQDASGLKTPEEIADDLAQALTRIDTPKRRQTLQDALQPLREEPSFTQAEYELDLLGNADTWRSEFARLSTGHKISVNIVVQLVGHLQQGSLVLIDEPESHLHPPLLAALIKGIGTALDANGSYAVIATHSPVVLQEIPGIYAHVLRRHGSHSSVEEPSIETFGENVGLLTRHVFNLDNSHSDYEGILLDLAQRHSLEAIESMFEHGLSSQARSVVMQAQRSS